MGQAYSPMPQARPTNESAKQMKTGAVEMTVKFSVNESKKEPVTRVQQLQPTSDDHHRTMVSEGQWTPLGGQRAAERSHACPTNQGFTSVRGRGQTGESGRVKGGRVSLRMNGEVQLKQRVVTGSEMRGGECRPVEVNRVTKWVGLDKEATLQMTLSKQRRPSLPEFMRDWRKLRVEHRTSSYGSNIREPPFDGMIDKSGGSYTLLSCSLGSTDHLHQTGYHGNILHLASPSESETRNPAALSCDDAAEVCPSGDEDRIKSQWIAEHDIRRQCSRTRSRSAHQQEDQRECFGRIGAGVSCQLQGRGQLKDRNGQGKFLQRPMRGSSHEDVSIMESRVGAASSSSSGTCGKVASAMVEQRQRCAPSALESKLRENLERMLMRELQGRGQENRTTAGRSAEHGRNRTTDGMDVVGGQMGRGRGDGEGVVEGSAAGVTGRADWSKRKQVEARNDGEEVELIDLRALSAWKRREEEGETRMGRSIVSLGTKEPMMTTTTHNDVISDHRSDMKTGDVFSEFSNNAITRNCHHFKEYDGGVSKGVSFRSDASSLSCIEPCRTLHRSVVQELLDGEIEIHRSNSILSSTSSAATPSSSRPKPVAMVQPRKVQGVRVLPPPSKSSSIVFMQPIPKPRSLQQKPPFSGPRRQRIIQRAPAIRSAKPYVSTRHQVANPPTANQDAHEFQRVGLRLRGGTNRSSGQRHPTKETIAKTSTQTGHEVRHFLQDSKRFRLKHLAKVKDGNWRTATRVATKDAMHTPLAAETGAVTTTGAHLDGRMTETLLQAKKKDAEIAALLLQVQKDELDGDKKRTSSDFENSSLISMQTNFENSLGYFP